MTRPPLPPFTRRDAVEKVRMAENAWNTRDPVKVAQAYTPDTRWRNRSEFLHGRAEVEAFLTGKWAKEIGYRLIKEIWAHSDSRIAVRFCYEWHDRTGPVVSCAWQRKLGIRRGGLHGRSSRLDQRCADLCRAAPLPLAARSETRRASRIDRVGLVTRPHWRSLSAQRALSTRRPREVEIVNTCVEDGSSVLAAIT